MDSPLAIPAIILLVFPAWLFNCLNILPEYERAVVFRLGRVLKREKGPGLVLIFWPIDKIVKVSLRVVTWDIPPQDIITRDNVSLKVNAVVYFRVLNATKAIIEVENFRFAVEQAAQTSLRSVLGEVELDDLLAQREKLNARLQAIIDEHTESWGIKVTQVQVKQVDLPQEMQRAIAAQAEAERERRAKIIAAEASSRHPRSWPRRRPSSTGSRSRSRSVPSDLGRDRRGEEHDDRVSFAARSPGWVGHHVPRERGALGESRAAGRVGGRHASTSFTSTSAAACGSRPTNTIQTNAETSSLAVSQKRHVARGASIFGSGCRVLCRLSWRGDAAAVQVRRTRCRNRGSCRQLASARSSVLQGSRHAGRS